MRLYSLAADYPGPAAGREKPDFTGWWRPIRPAGSALPCFRPLMAQNRPLPGAGTLLLRLSSEGRLIHRRLRARHFRHPWRAPTVHAGAGREAAGCDARIVRVAVLGC